MIKFNKFVITLSLLLVASCGTKNNESSIHVDAGREGFISLYALNDYHGRISYNESQKYNGIAKVSAFLNEQKYDHELEYVLLNSGDLWQDTYESNYNKGKCLTEVMDYMGCEAMELGNHEFDWSLDTIKENRKISGACTYLGANIFYYDNEIGEATTQASDLCDPYKIVERNGYRIGVIGVIGKTQITSITSSNWENITFVDPLEVVQNYSNDLRMNQNCDLIVLLAHADTSALSFNFCNNITSINSDTGKPYIDCCFTGHTHSLENKEYNNIPFVQGEWAGNYVSHIEFDMRGDSPVCTAHESLFVKTDKSDSNVENIINKYITKDFISLRDEKVCTFTNMSSISTSEAGKLQSYTTYQTLKRIDELKNIEIAAVINNGGRDKVRLPSDGVATREMLFTITPFTNITYVAKVKGSNLKNAITKYSYFAPKNLKINYEDDYYVACIDYLLIHKDDRRKYDIFSLYEGEYTYKLEQYPDEILYNELKGQTIDRSLLSSPEFSNLS